MGWRTEDWATGADILGATDDQLFSLMPGGDLFAAAKKQAAAKPAQPSFLMRPTVGGLKVWQVGLGIAGLLAIAGSVIIATGRRRR